MISHATADDPFLRERVIVITGGDGAPGLPELVDSVREWYPNWSVVTHDTYLAAIADVAAQPARAIIGWSDPTLTRMADAIAGLRESVGDDTPIVLCCTPEQEPFARSAITGGATDYLVCPLNRSELDRALRCPDSEVVSDMNPPGVSETSASELQSISDLLGDLDALPMELVSKLASLAHSMLPTVGVSIVVEGAIASSGDTVHNPVLRAPLTREGATIGQLLVGAPKAEPYSPQDARRVECIADLAGRILAVASAQRKLRKLAMTDECTGLPNRRYFHHRLDEILDEAKTAKIPVTILLFDVDNFKQFNDTYGHDAGDEVLRLAGELFARNCRTQDVVARYGGDEFAVIFWDTKGPRVPGSKHPECALTVLKRVQEALRTQSMPHLSSDAEERLTISGGLATFPWDASTRATLLTKADEALLAAKRAGKNRIFLIGQDE